MARPGGKRIHMKVKVKSVIWVLSLAAIVVAAVVLLLRSTGKEVLVWKEMAPPRPKMALPPERLPPAKANHDPLAAIDRLLEGMDLGNISFNVPRSLNLHDTAMIHLVLGVEKTIDELKEVIEAEGEKIGARIRVSNRMEARLSGQHFKIEAITPEVQAVSKSEVTEWKWEVTPEKEGRQFLHLTLSALLSVEGESTPRVIRTFDRTIDVRVTWGQRTKAFFQENWQWLWAAVLVPLAGWIWKRRKSPS